ncbi:MAG: tandem-95 repeat protein, partial [Actinomycetia bacterium]|nr:tandem-95 repeat protein [Actinomycetes bacterium]
SAVDATSVVVVSGTTDGNLTNNGDGTFDYAPDADFFGADTFTYTITDSSGAISNPATVTINVTPENDAPAAFNDGGLGYTTLEDTAFDTPDITANDTDLEDGGVDSTSITIASGPTSGSLFDNSDGTFLYTPVADASGTIVFTYTVDDTESATSNIASVTITVTPVNDAPSFTGGADVTVLQDGGVYSEPGWATAMSAGPIDEAGQVVGFIVNNDNEALFASQPVVTSAGELTFDTQGGASGVANVDVTLVDDGGIANGGQDSSTVFGLVVEITAVPADFDGWVGPADNCPSVFNIDQMDTDGDGIGDACDTSPVLISTGTFIDSGQGMGNNKTFGVAAADFDGDGHVDMAFANRTQPNKVWLNDGSGTFIDSGAALANNATTDLATGDLDGDGDFDLVFSNEASGNGVWLNDGSGVFTPTGQVLSSASSFDVALGDYDGDGDIDVAFANYHGEANTVWFNDGTGTFVDSGQALGSSKSHSIATHDLDGDGDLDLLFGNDGEQNVIWANDGTGVFTFQSSSTATNRSHSVQIVDVDMDGILDMAIAEDNGQDTFWLGTGGGGFTGSAQTIGLGHSRGISVGDIDGDGDPDVVLADHSSDDTVWFNNPAAPSPFSDSGQTLSSGKGEDNVLVDVDNDGDLDVVVAQENGPNMVWLNN